MHPWTVRLMARLEKEGWLIRHLNGDEYSIKRALFDTEAHPPGKLSSKERFVMLVKAAIAGTLLDMPDCKVAPSVVECSWGIEQRLNKKPKDAGSEKADAQTAPEAAAAPDLQPEPEIDPEPMGDVEPYGYDESEVLDDGADEINKCATVEQTKVIYDKSSSAVFDGLLQFDSAEDKDVFNLMDLKGQLKLIAQGYVKGVEFKMSGDSTLAYFDFDRVREACRVSDRVAHEELKPQSTTRRDLFPSGLFVVVSLDN
jgi:hypothetical protein